MAIGTPTVLKDNGPVTTSGQMQLTVTGVPVTAGQIVTVCIAHSNAGTAVGDPVRVFDGVNDYVKDDAAHPASNTVYVSQWSFVDTVGGTRAITVVLPAPANYIHVVVVGTSGADTTLPPRDSVGGGDFGGTAAVSIVASSNTQGTDEASIVTLSWASATAPTTYPSAGYTSLVNTQNALRTRSMAVAQKTPLTSGAAETFTATLASAGDWAGALTTYRGAQPTAGAPPGPQPLLIRLRNLLEWGPPLRGMGAPGDATVAAAAPITITASPADLTLSAAAPSGLEQANAPPGSLTLDTAAPAAALVVSPTAPALTLGAVAPTLAESAGIPAAALLTLSAGVATLAEAAQTSAALLTLGAATPTIVSGGIVLGAPAGSLTLSAAAPSLAESSSPPPASLTLGTGTTTLAETVKPTAALTTLGTAAPSAALQPSTTAPLLTLSAPAAKLAQATNPPPATLTLSAAAPAMSSFTLPNLATVRYLTVPHASLRSFPATTAATSATATAPRASVRTFLSPQANPGTLASAAVTLRTD